MSKDSSSFVADQQLIQGLETRAKAVVPGPDGVLFRQGDPPIGVYIVRQGHVILTMHTAGEATLQTGVGPGSLLGLPAVIGDKPYSLTAIAEENSELRFVSSNDFIELMHSESCFSFHVLQVLAQEVRAVREAYSELVDATQ